MGIESQSHDSQSHAQQAPGHITPLEVAREIFPDKPDDWLDFVLWNRTAYPMNLPSEWRLQLFELRDAIEVCPEGKHLCEYCNRVAVTEWLCEVCTKDIAQAPASVAHGTETVTRTEEKP